MKIVLFIYIILNVLYLLKELLEKRLDFVYLGNIILFIILLIKGV